MVNESQVELFLPVRGGFESDDKLHRRNSRALEAWTKTPFVTNAKIKDATITSAKIESLEADKITAGTLTADITVTGMLSVPATTGWRVEIGNPTYPLLYWDGTTTRFRLDTAGNVTITGIINATGGTVTGNLLVTGLIQSPATTGYRVEMGNSSFPLRYWDGFTTKFVVDTSGNVAASDLTVTQSTGTTTGIRVRGATNSDASQPAIQILNSSNVPLWTVRNDGQVQFLTGSGAGTYNLLKGRSDGTGLTCSGQMVCNQGVTSFVAPGALVQDSDFDFGITPINGTIAFTNNAGTRRLGVRLGGAWYHVTLT